MAKTKDKKGIRKDKELYEQIVEWFKRSKDNIDDKKVFDQADVYQRLYDNNPWDTLPKMFRPEHLTKMRVPIACDVVETGLSVATARAPMPDIEPELDRDKLKEVAPVFGEQGIDEKEFLSIMGKVSTAYSHGMQKEMVKNWRKLKMQKLLRTIYREKGIKGTDFIRIEKDQDKDKIINEVCGIYHIFPTPGLYSIEEHTRDPFIYAPTMTANKAKEVLGITAIGKGALRTEKEAIEELHINHGVTDTPAKPQTMGKVVREGMRGDMKKKASDTVIILRCYMPADMDDFEEYDTEVYVKNEDGTVQIDVDRGKVNKQTKKDTKSKFPSGYKCVVIILDHTDWIVDEYDCYYAPHGEPQPPFVRIAGYLPNKSFWGVSEIKQIDNLIAEICLVVSNLADVIRLTGNAPLVKTKGTLRVDATTEEGVNLEPQYAMPGETWEELIPNSMRYLQPPSTGFDAKWFLEWMLLMIDRVTHINDAIRGFNQYAQDSGKKIKELRMAALGTFGPKLDEVVEFCVEVYCMWAWIYQNLFSKDMVILQKDEDTEGEANFEDFIPAIGLIYDFFIDVSAESLIPEDPQAKFEETVLLYNMGMKRTGKPLVPAEAVIDAAPNIDNKQRIFKYVSKQQKEEDIEKIKQGILQELEGMLGGLEGLQPGTSEEANEYEKVADMIQQVPEILFSPLFQAMPERLRNYIESKIFKQQTNQIEQGEK